MGLGTKIKEVLHSDKETKHTTADTSKTPGAFPSEDVPRSQKHADTSALESSGSPRTDTVPGKNSSDYTYGANDSSLPGRDGSTSDRHDTTTGTHTTTGATGSHDRTGSHDLTGSHHNKLGKDSTTTAPYWGDAERTGGGLDKHSRDATTTGATGGRYSPTSRTADNELNHGSRTGMGSGRDATYGSSGSSGAPQTHGLTGAGGSTGLAHRALDTDATTRRDHKIDEYDAPSNSHGRGHGGHGSLPGAAGAGLGAAALANQHHREDMRDYDTQRYDSSGMGGAGSHGMGGDGSHGMGGGMNSGRGFHDSYDNSMSPGGNNGMGHNTMGGSGMGSNTMGAAAGMGANGMGHNGMGSNTMGHNGTGSNTMGHTGMGATNNTMGGNGMGMTRGGPPPGMPGQGPSLLDPHSRNTSPQQVGGAMGTGMGSGNGYGGSNAGSEYGGAPLGGGSVMPRIQQNASGMGDGHFGPGHPGAKVLHRCDHCGNDNDISKYFSKEAVYRMS